MSTSEIKGADISYSFRKRNKYMRKKC